MNGVYFILTGILSFGLGMLVLLLNDYDNFRKHQVPRRWREYLEYKIKD